MINFLNYIPYYIHGSIITLTDLYLELSKYKKCNIYNKINNFKNITDVFGTYKTYGTYLNSINQYISIQKLLKNYILLKDIIQYKKEYINENDINITTFYVLWKNLTEQLNILEHSNTLIVLDTLDIYLSNRDDQLQTILDDIHNKYKKIYLLCNPFNIKILESKQLYDNINIIEYYNKLSPNRINKLGTQINDNRILIKSEILTSEYSDYYLYNDNKKFINTLEFKGHGFMRTEHSGNKDNPCYIENIGKLFFEYLYLGKNIDYYTYNIEEYDGMCYYMKLLGLDGTKNNINVNIDKEKMYNKVIFDENDLIFKIIEVI